jgi:hypothetical protein
MPEQEQTPKRVRRRSGPLRPGGGSSGIATLRMTQEQKAKMEDAATRAEISFSEFVRKSALWFSPPERLNALMADHSHREDTTDPMMKAYRDERRRKSPYRRK